MRWPPGVPTTTSWRSQGVAARGRQRARRGGDGRRDQREVLRHRRRVGARPPRGGGLTGRALYVLPRSLAEGAAPQASPGGPASRPSRPPGCDPAAPGGSRPTGPTTPTRCARCSTRNRRSTAARCRAGPSGRSRVRAEGPSRRAGDHRPGVHPGDQGGRRPAAARPRGAPARGRRLGVPARGSRRPSARQRRPRLVVGGRRPRRRASGVCGSSTPWSARIRRTSRPPARPAGGAGLVGGEDPEPEAQPRPARTRSGRGGPPRSRPPPRR